MTQIVLEKRQGRLPCPARNRRQQGFTLIEVLVVIGIIALLISILLPSLNAAQQSALRVSCAANLRTIGQAYATYTGESNGRYPHVNTTIGPNGPWGLPLAGNPPLPAGHPDGIAIVVSQGYLPDQRVLYCPGGERIRDNSTASTGNKNAAGMDNLKFWAQAKQTGVWHPGPNPDSGMHQTGYAIWANWIEEFEDRTPSDIRANWFASGLKEKGDRVVASDHMIRGAPEFEDWNGHLLKKRKVVGTTAAPNYPDDPNPDLGVTFAGGNVLYNDGHVIWKDTTETVWRMEQENTGFHVFW